MPPDILANLRNILAILYPDESSIRRIMADAGIDSPGIVLNAMVTNSWHSVLSEAAKIGQVEVLLGVVAGEYGSNAEFRTACAMYQRAASQPSRPKSVSPMFGNEHNMPLGRRFDPQKFIDREFEQELFEELLQLKDQARILAIKDAGGMGKSQLLQKFQYRCRTAGRPRIPVSLVDLGQLGDKSPLGLVLQLQKELAAFLQFPNFARLDSARRDYDFGTIRGIGSATSLGFNDEQQAFARERCAQAFLSDLADHCQRQTVVLLFDGYEHGGVELQTWLIDHFLEPHCFNLAERAARLVIVLAGRAVPDFEQHWSAAECATIVKSVRALGKWTTVHVEECLQVHGYQDFTPQDVAAFHRLIGMGIPPSDVVGLIQRVVAERRRAA